MFQLVNTNFLVPIITTYNSLEVALEGLQQETVSRLLEYSKNIYMIEKGKENVIYTSDGTNIYFSKLTKTNEKKIIYTNKKITYMGTEYYQTIREQELTFDTNIKPDMNMNIIINEKKNSNVRFINDNIAKEQNSEQISIQEKSPITNNIINNNINNKKEIKNEIKDDKKEEMIKMIEEVNELYQKELSKIRKLQLNLKTFDAKLKKLERTKMDNIINDIIRTQSEYRTWKKIKYSIKDENDDTDVLKPINELEKTNEIVSIDKVPILFLSKFNYMENIQKNESIGKLLDEINQLNLNDLYSDVSLPNNNIVQFCNKYMKLSKELHYHFDDHEWSYLEHEMNMNSTNKLGSNVVSSNKIE